jgi:hypothetical protein
MAIGHVMGAWRREGAECNVDLFEHLLDDAADLSISLPLAFQVAEFSPRCGVMADPSQT